MKNSFDKIKEEIAKEVADRADGSIGVVATKRNQTPMTSAGMPDVAAVATGIVGTIVSKPGTERVILDGNTFQFMECSAATPGREKKRFCVVEKGKPATYGNQFINSTGERTHIITKDLYVLLSGVLHSASKQISDMNKDLNTTREQRDLYKLTIDALRKNGIID
jgi:hypothetical protein